MSSRSVGLRSVVGLGLLLVCAVSAQADPEDFCARVRNDDRVRAYDPSLRPGFLHAYKRLFPKANGGLGDARLRAEAFYRCMDGRFVACFIGANRPCAKIKSSRENPGSEAYCRANPHAEVVPLAASGHDSQFTYRCVDGEAEISGATWTLDARGFARELWAPMDLD